MEVEQFKDAIFEKVGIYSIFSLKNEPEGGSEAIRRRVSFLVWFLSWFGTGSRAGGKVEILGLDFHFSTASSPGRWECGNRDRDFQGLWAGEGNLLLVFLTRP